MKKCIGEDDLGSTAENNEISKNEAQAILIWSENGDRTNSIKKTVTLTKDTTFENIETDLRTICPPEFLSSLNWFVIENTERNISLPISLEDCLSRSRLFKDMFDVNQRSTYTISTYPSTQSKQSYQYSNDNSEDDLLLGASASPTTGEAPTNEAPHAVDFDEHRRIGPNGDGEPVGSSVEPISAIEMPSYVGLVNQAMTCYLNSLVQALYMTPEFRNALYNWEFDGVNESRSIPYQLQRLFLNLQTSERSAVETTDLTTSFGWQGSEAWHQHDVQELCRVMFDALERKFKDTKQANLINDLYEGKMLDYVKCLDCGTEKSREDTFLDIPLPVRPFGCKVAYNSIEEALRAFVQPETLDGNNQYFCEKCNKKCDAHKGLKFIKFPYLLTLHLKRFDFDYNTLHRIKLNDKVVFPEKLNLNSFVPNNQTDEHSSIDEIVTKCDDCSTTDSGSALDDESCQGTDASSAVNDDNCEDSDEGIDVSSGTNHISHNHEPDAKGPYNYELFSIMIHSGSASGGHYYAYIKDFDKDYWLCFNDQSVNRITEDDIRKTYGGGPQKSYYSGMYTSSTNAYMLMYRQIDKSRNCDAMKVEEFPQHVQNLLVDMRNREKKQATPRERFSNSYRLSINCFNPLNGELVDTRISVLYDLSLQDATYMALKRFKFDMNINQEDCRLVVFNKKQSCIDCSFEGETEVRFCDIAEQGGICFTDWLLEIKQPGTTFRTYRKGGINMRVYLVNIDTEDVQEPIFVRVDVGDTVSDLKTKLLEEFDNTLDVKSLKIVLCKLFQEPVFCDDDDTEISFDNSSQFYKIYISNALNSGDRNDDIVNVKPFKESKLFEIIERFELIVHINILLPDTDPDTLENLFIPNLLDNFTGIEEIERGNSLRASPQQFGDQSNSEDSSLSDSDRTLVGETPNDYQSVFTSTTNSPADQPFTSDRIEDPYQNDNWDIATPSLSQQIDDEGVYFKVITVQNCRRQTENAIYTKQVRLFADTRITIDQLKKNVEQLVRVPRDYFKIYHQYMNSEKEITENLRKISDGHTLTVRLGRALNENEHNCKVYYLKPESGDTNHFLFDHIITAGQTVADLKRQLLLRAKKLHMMDIPLNKARLREKYVKKPKRIYFDDQQFGNEITIFNNYEIYLQELQDTEKVTSFNQLILFARHWCPSTLTLQPFHEIVLDSSMMDELKDKVSDLAEIPAEFLQISLIRESFPCDMHLLDIHSELIWKNAVTNSEPWPLHTDDGTVFFYRDSREQLKELTSEERRLISISENKRLGRVASRNGTTGERSLRIYSDNWPSENEDCMD